MENQSPILPIDPPDYADDYNSPWKEALERYFPEFMAFYFPAAHDQIDWSLGHEFLDQELRAVVQDAELGKRLVDKLVRVTRRSGTEDWIYIHLEVQGSTQAEFAERMFVYNDPQGHGRPLRGQVEADPVALSARVEKTANHRPLCGSGLDDPSPRPFGAGAMAEYRHA